MGQWTHLCGCSSCAVSLWGLEICRRGLEESWEGRPFQAWCWLCIRPHYKSPCIHFEFRLCFSHVSNMFKSSPLTSPIMPIISFQYCLLFTSIYNNCDTFVASLLHLPRNINASRLRGMCAGPGQSQGTAATHGEGEDLSLTAQRTNGQYLFAWLFNLGLCEWCWSLVGKDDHKVGPTRRVVYHPWWKTRCFNLWVSCIAALPSPAVGFYLQRNPFLFFY